MITRRTLLAALAAVPLLPLHTVASDLSGQRWSGGNAPRYAGGHQPRWDKRQPIFIRDRLPEAWRPVVVEAVDHWNAAIPFLRLVHVVEEPGSPRQGRGIYLLLDCSLTDHDFATTLTTTPRGLLRQAKAVFGACEREPQLHRLMHELAHALGIWGHAPRLSESVTTGWWFGMEGRFGGPGKWDYTTLYRLYIEQPRQRRARIKARRPQQRREQRRQKRQRRRERRRKH